ncbi:kinase-like protein KLPA [Cordyceps fumosorosea ARSEF 2679]|uniref:Kinesin-like protein n=1 Tax=Cordyceps fumosorosea (strain ARSEF 2679) TaxID=1081104 RepID=A0A167MJJ1_CORFA|nr:kinase-like protein KLPA [Cordyceps fumosorosea ARSEF 2679]OAA54431.1 kinase-like protein KLPA [Cordyceps fumosorosea ARSEF 2679]
MELSENQLNRSSRISRLPGPSAPSGLSELSESQHNTRSQSAIPAPGGIKNLKRETPQPASQSEPKRKLLSDRAAEYPPKATHSYATRANVVQGHALTSVPSLKSSYRQQPGQTALLGSFAKSFGPGRDRPAAKTNAIRPPTSRLKHVPRPKTSHGHRDEDLLDQSTTTNVWDVDGRVGDMESRFEELKDMVNITLTQKKGHDDALELAKTRVAELENDRQKLTERSESLRNELDNAREEGHSLRRQLDEVKWESQREVDQLKRDHSRAIEDLDRQHRTAFEDHRRELNLLKEQGTKQHSEQIKSITRDHERSLEEERQRKDREMQDLRSTMGREAQDMSLSMQRKERELQDLRAENDSLCSEIERQKSLNGSLQSNISEISAANVTLEAKLNSVRSQVEFLESDSKAQSDSFANMEARLQEALRLAEEAKQKLIKEETERRVLFNKYQELKGNIRVMCRVRPPLGAPLENRAGMNFPDEKTSAEIVLAGPEERSSLGVVSRKNYPFEFDRVFMPASQNEEIFGEISQLVQSALDGYNVCIFCYGQTGSGKTHTMSSDDGMIPRATHMIYDTITKFKEKSWEYTMEGCFVEVYNEELNDLLVPNERNPKKLEIRHDEARKQTTIINCKTVILSSPDVVETMLSEAQKNRSVAATKANERSSRSHSIFILKLVGKNLATGEQCEGTLNLVDLAGSERLKHSQAEGERMKETQNINKSLSCLGDVIEALGRGSGHIPYRNSKLTHLLQYSLGGNSKTLMFVMVSPLEVHLKETLTSLRFATKVHNTHIGTAKATKRIKGGD